MSERGTVVVGVDGSDCSRAALRFALDEAARRRAAVRVVSAVPEQDYWASAYGLPQTLLAELSADAERTAKGMLDEVLGEQGCGDVVPVDVRVAGGPPAAVLVEQSRDADLLVVGHRGRGAFRSAALGSVGLQCVLHATVPVTVVRR